MKLTISIFLIAFFLLSCGPKKKVEKFENPKSVLFLSTNLKVPATKKIQSNEKEFEIQDSDSISINSRISIQKKEGSDEVFYELKCPERLKQSCKDDKIYITGKYIKTPEEIQGLIESNKDLNNVVLLQESTLIEKSKITRDWILSPGKIESLEIDLSTLMLMLGSKKSKDEQYRIIEELLLVFTILENPEYEDKVRIDPIFKKYAILNKNTDKSKVKGIEETKAKLIELEKDLNKKIISGFPMRSQSYKGLVDQFNKLKKTPYLQEELFSKILIDSIYNEESTLFTSKENSKEVLQKLGSSQDFSEKFSNVDTISSWKIEINKPDGVKLISESMNKDGSIINQEDFILESISAFSDTEDVSFKIKTDKKEFKLVSANTGSYLLSGGPGLKEYIKSFPEGRYKEYLSNQNYYKAVIMSALKEGKGGFNEDLGLMEFEINSKDSYKYWVMLEIFRMHPLIERKSDYSGSFVSDSCETANLWRQPKGELYIGCMVEVCDSKCKNELVEEICMSESEKGGSETMYIRFSPSDLKAENPKVSFEISSSKKSCDNLINGLLNQ